MCLGGEKKKRRLSLWTVKGLSEARARPPKPVCSNIITQREIDTLHAAEPEPHYQPKVSAFQTTEFSKWSRSVGR